MFNVVCLKWGTKYTPEYVNNLYSMVKRNTTLPFKFYCFTDDKNGIHHDINAIELSLLVGDADVSGITGWWYKLAFFKETILDLTGKILYLDLDIVIIDNIDAILLDTNKFSIVKEWHWDGYNSSIFTLDIGEHSSIWDKFLQNKHNIMKRLHGDQNWIDECINDANTWPPEWCISFKYHCAKNPPPNGTKIVIFHGFPNPPDAIKKCHAKYIPAPWIADHWKED